jgi:hypothetical protein
MTPGDWILFVVVGALASNHLLLRLSWMFWPVQLMNLAAAGYLVGVGLPGFSGNLTVVNYVMALLFIVRAVQNNNRWGKRKGRRATAADGDAEARKEAIREALRRGESQRESGMEGAPSAGADRRDAPGREGDDA